VRGRDLGSTVTEAQARIKRREASAGYRIICGRVRDLQLAKERLRFVPVSFADPVLLFSCSIHFRQLLALAGIPFAVGGGIIAFM